MRICIVSHILIHTDGQGRVNYATAAWLAKQGHELVLIASELSAPLRDAPNVAWIRAAVPRRMPTALLKEQGFAWRVRRALLKEARRNGPFDIVQMNGCAAYIRSDVNVANFVHADWMKSPHHTARARGGIYGLYHRAYTRLNMAWERRAYRKAGAVIAVSNLIEQSLIRDVGIEPAKIHTLPPGVNSDEFRPLRSGESNELRQKLNIPPDGLLVLFAGDARLNRKNLDLVLASLAESGVQAHLAVAGRLAADVYPPMVQRLGLSGRVHFLGMRSDLPAVMRCADVFAFPSHYDPFALVVTEAMASGLAVITAPSVGAASVICSGKNGFVLSDSNDAAGMIALLRRLDADRGLVRRIGAAARETTEALSWESMARQYETIYAKVVANRASNIEPRQISVRQLEMP